MNSNEFLNLLSKEEQKEEKNVSLFAYKRGNNLQYCPVAEEMDWGEKEDAMISMFGAKTYGVVEKEIICMLYKFQYLNKFNMERYLNQVILLPDYAKKENYDANIKRLVADGVLLKYTMDKRDPINDGILVLYALSPAGYQYIITRMEEERTHSQEAHLYTINTADVLEKMSLNQWHISLLANYGACIKKEYYGKRMPIDESSFYIASCCILDKNSCILSHKNTSLFALALPKGTDNILRFVKKVSLLNQYIEKNKYKFPNPIIIVTCESTKIMGDAYRVQQTIEEMKCLHIFYSLDINTGGKNPLSWLYLCGYDEDLGAIEYKNIMLCEKIKKKDRE